MVGEHPASLCLQNLLKFKYAWRGGQERCLETQSWGYMQGRRQQEPSTEASGCRWHQLLSPGAAHR